MSGPGIGSAPKKPKNPLLYGADLGFPFDNLQGSAILMPIAHEETSEPTADASKPPANILLQEPTLPPAPIPSAAAPLFSLFKQALGAVTEESKPPEPEPAKEPTSEVPLYAPTAAPVPVPLFDPKTLEVNGNEPSEDVVNGNELPPPPTVSFFNPSQFQSSIAALKGAKSPPTPFNPSEFTQQPPPDLPAPTPKSEVQNQGVFTPVFTTAPSQEVPSTTLSTSSGNHTAESHFAPSEPQSAPQEVQKVENEKSEAEQPPSHEASNRSQNYGAEQAYGGVEQSQPQFYDPSYGNFSYGDQNQGQYQDYYYQNNYYPQNPADVQQYQHYQYYNQEQQYAPPIEPPRFYDPSQYGQMGQSAAHENVPRDEPPQFYNPNQYSQNEEAAVTENVSKEEPVLAEPPQFYNPNQYDQEKNPAATENVPKEEPVPVDPPQFYNPNQYSQSEQPAVTENVPKEYSTPAEPTQFYNPNQYSQNELPKVAENVPKEEQAPAEAPQFYNPNLYSQSEQPAVAENFPKEEPPASLSEQSWGQEQPQQISFFNPNQFYNPTEGATESAKEASRDIPFPSPPPPVDYFERQDQSESSFDDNSQVIAELEKLNLQEQTELQPLQLESCDFPQPSYPAPVAAESPMNVYSIPQNQSIYNPLPTENRPPSSIPPPEPVSANLPPEPPVSSTPLSAYFSQKQDSRPSSVASNRSQLASFFDDGPSLHTTKTGASIPFSQGAADFFNAPKVNSPLQSVPATGNAANFFSSLQTAQAQPQIFNAFSQSQPSASQFFNPQPAAEVRSSEPAQVAQEPPVVPPGVQHFSPVSAPKETPPPPISKNEVQSAAAPTPMQFFNPGSQYPPQKEPPSTQTPFLQTAVAENQSYLTQFFTNDTPAQASSFFQPEKAASQFFEPQLQTSAPPPNVPTEVPQERKQSLPPQAPQTASLASVPVQTSPAAQSPPAVQSPPTASTVSPPGPSLSEAGTNEPGIQLFNPTLFGQSQRSGSLQVDGNKFRIKTALNKYALPPALSNRSNSIPSYFAPPASFGVTPQPPSHSPPLIGTPPGPSQTFSPPIQPEILQVTTPPGPPKIFSPVGVASPENSAQPTPANVSSFFKPQLNFNLTNSSQESQKCKTPPNTPAVIPGMMNPLAQSVPTSICGGITEITEEAVNQALQSSAPITSSPSEPPSIPVSVSQIQPKYPTVVNPYSNSAAQKPQPQYHPQQTSYFNPGQAQNVPLTEDSSSAQPLPPPKTTMSGNSYRLNSRPQYAPPPGLGSSVSAIASLAASMAMSSPIPASGAQPHDGFAPIPSIAIGASQAEPGVTPSLSFDSAFAVYERVPYHWFFKKVIEKKEVWSPFSVIDSNALEAAFQSGNKDVLVHTDGGRYDVHVYERNRVPIYWDQAPNEVRRCSWFYKNPLDSRSYPYEESFAEKLEEEYRTAFLYNKWPRRIELSFGEAIMFSGPNVMSHIPPTSGSILEDWGTIQETGAKSRIVRRGCDEFEIDEGEPGKPDHLIFLVHGIGSVCDLKFRTVVEVVDDFRTMALTLVRSHFRQAKEDGRVNRVEILPVSWHGALHGEETGIDKQLQNITLRSIPKLRHFTNDTLLDILFYTSPVYCETIIQTVGHEMNRLQQLFMQRNPEFNGGISLGGHSLGSLILFDLLVHQIPEQKKPQEPTMFEVDKDESGQLMRPPALVRRDSCKVDYMMGHGTGQPSIHYPQLNFTPTAFFALGSPVGMFVTVRGIESLGQDFCLPTCPAIFNIFHPFDPVAYRIEALINPELAKSRPVLIPHHKGRKRMHIELRETMQRVSTDIKEKLIDSVKSTWNTVYQMAMYTKGENLVQEVDKVFAEQMLAADAMTEEQDPEYQDSSEPDPALLGKLNSGRRIDYVLQEAPLESFNEYLFALGSHVCYWESEDTMLLMLKETYSLLGASPDGQREGSIVREGQTRERSWSNGSKGSRGSASPSNPSFLNTSNFPPTPQMMGPPPTSGFVKK